MLRSTFSLHSIIEFTSMTDCYDSNHTNCVVYFVTNSPVAYAYAPQVLSVSYFKTSGRARICYQAVDCFRDAGQNLTVKPARFPPRSQA